MRVFSVLNLFERLQRFYLKESYNFPRFKGIQHFSGGGGGGGSNFSQRGDGDGGPIANRNISNLGFTSISFSKKNLPSLSSLFT